MRKKQKKKNIGGHVITRHATMNKKMKRYTYTRTPIDTKIVLVNHSCISV